MHLFDSLIPFSCEEVLHEMLDCGCELLVEASDTACNTHTWRLVEMLFDVYLFSFFAYSEELVATKNVIQCFYHCFSHLSIFLVVDRTLTVE